MVMFSKGVPFFKQAALTWEPHPCFPFQHHLIQLAVVPGGFIATLICEFPRGMFKEQMAVDVLGYSFRSSWPGAGGQWPYLF